MKNKVICDKIFLGDKMKTMKTFVYVPSENVKKKMIKYYENMKKDKTPPYSLFQATDNDTTITMYEKGKIMFQGANADMDFDMWAAVEKNNNDRNIYNDIKIKDKKKDDKKDKLNTTKEKFRFLKNCSTIGSDEVGTGDYFGPIVVTAAYVPKDKIGYLKELGVGDSKKISDTKILELGPILANELMYSSSIITNSDYNKINEINMNKLKAVLHNKVLWKLSHEKDIDFEKIVVDQFTTGPKYFEYLQNFTDVERNILFLTKAEDLCYSVAAASIISRYIFLKEMNKLSLKYNTNFPLGATNIDDFTIEFIKKHGEEVLNDVSKMNFKTTEKILNLIKKNNSI